MSEEKWKYECTCCPQRINCERTFGRYWGGKSHGAKGCYYGFGDMGEAERRVERRRPLHEQAQQFR